MLLTVRNRTIEINDELVARYEKIGFGSIDELFALAEISTTHRCHIDDALETLTDGEIAKTIEDAIMDYIDVSGV